MNKQKINILIINFNSESPVPKKIIKNLLY